MDTFFSREVADVKQNHLASTSNKDKIFFENVPFQNGAVVLMDHPVSLTLHKHLTLSVLTGSVSVNGYEVKRGESVQVFSSEKTGLIEITTETCESIWKKTALRKHLEQILDRFSERKNLATKILQKCGNLTVAIFVKCCAFPSNLEFAEFYCPKVFQFSEFMRGKNKNFPFILKDETFAKNQTTHLIHETSTLSFGEEEEKLASKIAEKIKNAKLIDCNFPRIIVCGPRNTGKSTLLQYFLNRMLSQYHDSYYLDTDPGQPEFTPPGFVSLTKVDKPVLGPPFFHLNKDSTMIFTGDISPSFIDLYSKSICTLMEVYNNEYADHPLFVNTMGWIEGIGLECLINIITTVKPTVLIEIVPDDGPSMLDYRDYLSPNDEYFQITCKHDQRQKCGLSSKMMRELSLLSHFGNCQPPHLSVLPINEFRPYCISWEKIPIFIFPGGKILSSRMVEALNGSIVALCRVPETCILESDIPEFPKTLECDPENECLAYGLVQAVDETDHLFYIISPLKEDEWAKVNAIIKGNIMVPDSLILGQDIYNMPLPYTNVNVKSSSEKEMDRSKISFMDVSETESNSPESKSFTHVSKIFPPLENYRKPISKRHKHFSKK